MAEDVTSGRPAPIRPAPVEPDAGAPRATDPAAARAVRVGLRVIALVAAAAALWLARNVLLLGFLSILVAIVLSFPVGLLARAMPRAAATLLVLAALLGAFTGLGVLAAPTLSRQAAALRETVPRVARDVRDRVARVQAEATGTTPPPLTPAAPAPPQPPEAVAEAGARAVSAAFDVVVGLTKVILVLVLAAFLVHRPDLYQQGLRRLVPPEHEEAFDEGWIRVRDALRRWVGGILAAMLIMGTLTAIGLLAVGIEDWLLLAFLTFVGTFVPYVGAVASAVPGLLVALGQSPRHFALALVVYVGVHVVEGYIVEPVVMRRAVEIKPALLLFGQGMLGAIFGAIGFVVATPLIVCGQTLVGYAWVERRLGKTVH
jgi:predicted PurR-regulated permease PerM